MFDKLDRKKIPPRKTSSKASFIVPTHDGDMKFVASSRKVKRPKLSPRTQEHYKNKANENVKAPEFGQNTVKEHINLPPSIELPETPNFDKDDDKVYEESMVIL